MIDRQSLDEVLAQYKENFSSHWKEEKYKWEAIKCFQDNWDVNAQDFPMMLSKSLSKTGNLLASANSYPRQIIEIFAQKDTEEVRSMFQTLFDENKDIAKRFKIF